MSNNKSLIDILKSIGLLFPTTSDEIIEFEKENNPADENPKDLENPMNVILRGKQQLKNLNLKINNISNSEIQNLAMAARDGKIISDEVRKKMIEDKKNAKKK